METQPASVPDVPAYAHVHACADQPGYAARSPHAWLHAPHCLPLNVDQQRRHLRHDGCCHNHSLPIIKYQRCPSYKLSFPSLR